MKAVLLFLIIFIFSACSSTKTKQQMKISIQLDVFSGRPNPSWELSPSESGELFNQLSLLPEADAAKAPYYDRLGYRGFIVSVYEKDTTSSPSIYRIFQGYVFNSDKLYSDKDSLEKSFIEQARKKGFADIIEFMQIEE